jgi:hypothetical protein
VKQTALFFALAVLTACSGITTTSDWDPGVDFSRFKTFALLEEAQPSVSRLVDQRVRAAIAAELGAKGLQQVERPEQADLAIGYQVTTEERTSYHTVHNGWRTNRYWTSRAHWGSSVGTSTTRQVNFTVGTLVVAAFQMGDKELVWEGSASATVDPSSGPERSEQRINEAVGRIFEDFPPGSKSP